MVFKLMGKEFFMDVKELVTRQKKKRIDLLIDEIKIGFLTTTVKAGGTDNWDLFSNMTFEATIQHCVANGIYISFDKLKEGKD